MLPLIAMLKSAACALGPQGTAAAQPSRAALVLDGLDEHRRLNQSIYVTFQLRPARDRIGGCRSHVIKES
jgi:hypothetical protein